MPLYGSMTRVTAIVWLTVMLDTELTENSEFTATVALETHFVSALPN